MIPVTNSLFIDDREIHLEFVRSSGPGGQNVNKVATAVQLRFDAGHSPSLPDEVRELLPRLRDPDFTRVLIVTLAEPTPVHEAEQLQNDLQRAGIQPFAWIVNRSLAGTETRDPVLRARGAAERPFIEEVKGKLATRAAIVPWVPDDLSAPDNLNRLVRPAGPAAAAAGR